MKQEQETILDVQIAHRLCAGFTGCVCGCALTFDCEHHALADV